MNRIEKYTDALSALPAPRSGNCHRLMMSVVSYGVMAGLSDDHMVNDIKGKHEGIAPREILDTCRTARKKFVPYTDLSSDYTPSQPKLTRKPKANKMTRLKYIREGRGFTDLDFISASPVEVPLDTPEQDWKLIFDNLYADEDILFIGAKFDKGVKTVAEWREFISENGTDSLPLMKPNPMTGEEVETFSGTMSYRCDNSVKDYRFVVLEFDDISRDDQLAFWSVVPLPICAIIDSGNKSLHVWLKTDDTVTNIDEWNKEIRLKCFEDLMVPMGIDRSGASPSAGSRFAGHKREVPHGRYQSVLYLNPNPDSKPINTGGK